MTMTKFNIATICVLAALSVPAHSQANKASRQNSQQEIIDLQKKKPVAQALSLLEVNANRCTADLIRLTEVPAPPFGEHKRGELFREMLIAEGAQDVTIDSIGNVLYLRKGRNGKKTVVLDAHLDTVFPVETDVKVKHHGDTLLAPGIIDDTRGLAVLLQIVRVLNQSNIVTDNNILFVASVGEEGPGDLRGVRYLLQHRTVDSWISLDAGEGGFGGITNGALGSVRYKVTVKGPGGHSWGAFGTGNTHHALARAIDYFTREATQYISQPGPKTSFNVGVIGGGTSVNSIPFESWMEVDMRSEDASRLADIDKIFQNSIRKGVDDYNMTLAKGPHLTVQFKRTGYRPSGATAADHPLVTHTGYVISYFGEKPEMGINSTNSNIPISRGIPAVTIGMGGKGGHPHSLAEWWMPDANATAAEKMVLVLVLLEAGAGN